MYRYIIIMTIKKGLYSTDNDCISINARGDIHFWCQRFAVSPFTLYQLLKNVGNSVRKIEKFLHNQRTTHTRSRVEEKLKLIPFLQPTNDI